MVEWYVLRWVVEEWHRVLKTDCRLEQRQLQAVDHLERLLVLLSAVVCRVRELTYAARTDPDRACDEVLSPAEWQTLWQLTHACPALPATPPTLSEATAWLERRGGFIPGPSRVPGAKVLWRGLAVLGPTAWLYAEFIATDYQVSPS